MHCEEKWPHMIKNVRKEKLESDLENIDKHYGSCYKCGCLFYVFCTNSSRKLSWHHEDKVHCIFLLQNFTGLLRDEPISLFYLKSDFIALAASGDKKGIRKVKLNLHICCCPILEANCKVKVFGWHWLNCNKDNIK